MRIALRPLNEVTITPGRRMSGSFWQSDQTEKNTEAISTMMMTAIAIPTTA